MKLIAFIFVTVVCFLSCNWQGENNQEKRSVIKKDIKSEEKNIDSNKAAELVELAKMKFKTKIINLGTIPKGDSTVKGRYTFKNIGEAPLFIEYINPDCVCTGYEHTKDSVAIGGEGYIDLTFNIKDRVGSQKLYAMLKANTKEKFYKLTLKLDIE
ncbi:DUF1573 domain-containing protein [Flavivirga spongiicola]|uniref:DUF1573 domain-containing protein n=1 Tax=Flavivirga spongiicola TaxID=421621 RepID=A0ABU7XV18_9FLAO|nr:DUF1573 domain-containing protein [Flavivirga sp. MEBiC05379]MDO5979427.1 DUF1573 domain-containing protein [Flavivirga sp. MEBiC05379]